MMSTEAFDVVIPDYPLYFKQSDKQRAKPFFADGRLPVYIRKGLKDGTYEVLSFDKPLKRPIIIDAKTKKVVPRNKKTVGTPKMSKVSGQAIWVGGEGSQWSRQKLKLFLENYFVPFLVRQLPRRIYPPAGHYIQLEFVFYCPLKQWMDDGIMPQDDDNHAFPYIKAIRDSLVNSGFVEDDSPLYMRGNYSRYVDTLGISERRLEMKIHFCKNFQAINEQLQ